MRAPTLTDTDGQPGGDGPSLIFPGLGRFKDDTFAKFSNFGEDIDLIGPGVQILSLKLGGGTTNKSGTSMSSPHVAGVAALVAAANPGATPAQIREALINTGECADGSVHDGVGCSKEWKDDPDDDTLVLNEPLVNAQRASATVISTPTPDTTGPTVTAVDPADLATNVAVTTNVMVTFSEPVEPTTVNSTTFTLNDGTANVGGAITVAADGLSATFTVNDGTANVGGAITVAANGLSATFDPDADLANGATTTVTVTSGVTDTTGNALDQDGDPNNGNQDFASSFTTAAAAATDTVAITKATYHSRKQTLTVDATSSAGGSVALTARAFDSAGVELGSVTMEYNAKKDKHSGEITSLTSKPFKVEVTSSGGGSASVEGTEIGGQRQLTAHQ